MSKRCLPSLLLRQVLLFIGKSIENILTLGDLHNISLRSCHAMTQQKGAHRPLRPLSCDTGARYGRYHPVSVAAGSSGGYEPRVKDPSCNTTHIPFLPGQARLTPCKTNTTAGPCVPVRSACDRQLDCTEGKEMIRGRSGGQGRIEDTWAHMLDAP